MNDIEDRVRRALRTDVRRVGVEQLLHDVHRGATRRRRRRLAGAIAASTLVIAGTAGVAITIRGDVGTLPNPPTTQPPSPSPTGPARPEGAAQGVIDVSVVSADVVYRLTSNVGCVACSTVWRYDPSADGLWQRLHVFSEDAYLGKVDAEFGPVTNFVMSTNGRDGWAWGDRLFSTHDGGRTWTPIVVSQGDDSVQGHAVHLTDRSAWTLLRSDQFGATLFRSPILDDVWGTPPTIPDLSGATDILTVKGAVAVETADEGLANPRLLVSTDDGAQWHELANPCPGENQIYPAESAAFILCRARSGATVYRSADLSDWKVFGHTTGTISAVHALDDDHLMIVRGAGKSIVITRGGTKPVEHLDLAPGVETFEDSSAQGLSYLTTSEYALLFSRDNGLTWHPMG
jgi:photosystem II stability/assembly factor-like uncharacterized protein